MLGGDLHPLYRAVLLRAIDVGYALPSVNCQRLQNKLVRDLQINGIWLWDYFYVWADDSGGPEFGRINWAQPNNGLGSGTAGYTIKKGINNSGGSAVYGFNWATDRILQIAPSDSSQIIYQATKGANPGATEMMIGALGANSIYQAWRMTTAGVQNFIHNTNNVGNTSTYLVSYPNNSFFEVGNCFLTTSRLYGYFNGTLTRDDSSVSPANFPSSGNITLTALSTRVFSILGSGLSAYQRGKSVLLNTFIQQYMTAVQALP